MKDLRTLDRYRVLHDAVVERYGGKGFDNAGMFHIPVGVTVLKVIATNGDGWDHVSVSCRTRCPTWQEMSIIAKMFFRSNECAFQLHVPDEDYVNNHPYTLHWWRAHKQGIPRPPKEMV